MWVRQITNEAARLIDAGEDHHTITERLAEIRACFGDSDTMSRDRDFMDSLTDDLLTRRENANRGGSTTGR